MYTIERHNAAILKLPNWQWELAYRVKDSEDNTVGYFIDTKDARVYIEYRCPGHAKLPVIDCQ